MEIGFSSYYLPESGREEYFVGLMNDINDEHKPVEKWEPLVLLKKEQRIDSDFFDIYDAGAVVTSKQGAAIFEAFCAPNDFQLLPFLNDERELFLFHLITPTDCLDKERSVFNSLDNGIITDYEGLSFNYEALKNKPVFKIPELPYTLFVTGDFKYYYDELELKGLDFGEEYFVV